MATADRAPKRVKREEWSVAASAGSMRFVNPIRKIVDTMKITPHPDKPMIPLSIGDPTTFGNFTPPAAAVDAVCDVVRAGTKNGYAKSVGYEESRAAIAKRCSRPGSELTKDDVVIASGCSGALEIAINVLADEGTNILLPAPGFSLYKTLASARGIETRSYRCLPERSWEIDLDHLASLVDSSTRAIVVTNPSNPCGSNFSKEHVEAIVAVASRCKVPIIADEIYADMVFPGHTFTSLAAVAGDTPVLACGGLAKQFLVPGWRLGWVCVHDRNGLFEHGGVKQGLINLSQLLLGACTVIQASVPAIFENTPLTWYAGVMERLQASAQLCFDKLSSVPGLTPVMPSGAMYMMCGVDVDRFPGIKDDRQFTEMLVQEQSVFCLPAEVFECPNYFRIVTTVPPEKLEEAMDRIAAFCAVHCKK